MGYSGGYAEELYVINATHPRAYGAKVGNGMTINISIMLRSPNSPVGSGNKKSQPKKKIILKIIDFGIK